MDTCIRTAESLHNIINWLILPIQKTFKVKKNRIKNKGNQPWIFVGRTDDKAEALILWSPDVKNWLLRKNPDARKDWRQKSKGAAEDEMVT